MSAVRMCDQCGRIFSENEDGWTTAPVMKMKRDGQGAMRPATEQRDLCPQDSGAPVNLRPRVDLGQSGITAGAPGHVASAAEIARLEQELGIPPSE